MLKENYLGVDVCPLNMGQVLVEVDRIILEKEPSFIVAINPEKIMKAQEDSNLKELLNSAALQIADGVGVVIASILNGGRIRSRVTGIDLMVNICKRAAEKGYGVYFLGAKPGVAETAVEVLKKRFKGLNVVGVRDGYYKDEAEVIKDIIEKKPDILFVAMGSPKQEYWIRNNMEKLNVSLYMGIGGSLDVLSGNIKRAPKFMRSCGLEWLYRLIKEPWRYKRMGVLPVFLYRVLKERFKK
ncbi:putative N-acetylmannosaminyltransferase [Caloramator mitchellensis]|uniref:N-acetylglucosaminyldiphosphoundecaprenol N-acetyl-beta-D-mannosaminyltransferase n=1 Tax=Caloramator mitchellensis TaxID=908809 RepID=A0A0R3JV65_CALMK|nr:WecB/TagA/CpsF family glycosyltransferase [Caloramator mitchellensis]KRQ87443.1 putative N-acetylmannosaminyltransferase [Caloramator mitchellensis]